MTIREFEVFEAYEKTFGHPVPIGFNGVDFADSSEMINAVQHAIDTNTPFPQPENEEGVIY